MEVNVTRCRRRGLLALVIATFASDAMSVEPVPLAISNPGFEADFVSEGCFEVLLPTAWPVYDPSSILDGGGNSVGGLNLPPGSVFFPAGAPQGDHAALVFLSSTIGAGPAGLSQMLSDTLQANTTYTLSVQVGNIASGIGPPPCDVFGFFDLDGFPGYQVQLLAGGVVIAEDDNSLAAAIPEGEFQLSTIQVTVGDTHPQLGDTLEIRLINLNVADTPGDPGIEVDFDDVRLVAQPACAALDGDFDTDCDVDLDDHAIFVACLNGPDVNTPPPGCTQEQFDLADLEFDQDVDLHDFKFFLDAVTANHPTP